MTAKTFALCALVVLGAGLSIQAQQPAKQPTAASGAANAGALGNAQAVDETTLALDTPAATGNQAAKSAGPDTFMYFLRMVIVLALVLGVMYLVFSLMRKLSRPREEPNSPIRILASTSLGTGKGVHLIGLGGKAWLVGSSEQGVALISEIDDRELLDGLELEAASRKPLGGDFGGILAGLLSPHKGGAKKEPKVPIDTGWISKQRERLGKFGGEER